MDSNASSQENLDRRWWKEAVVYEVYPRSFEDSDGDGVGNLRGIAERADYLDELGVDVVWLCPVYDTPNADNGYDIRDYRAIADDFGSMADWEAMRDALHDRGVRLIMDLVVNHTSDEHEWFERSRRREEGYEDYYFWREGSPDQPPNNWESFFGGSAWTYDEVREAWYLHLFDEKQPDLNWDNPDVRDDVAEMVTWWLEKGIDGFRLDAVNKISKVEGLPDGTAGRSPTGLEEFTHGPRIHEYLRELYDRTFSHYDAMTVAEMSGTTVDMAGDYLGEDGDGLDMIFHFEHMEIDAGPEGRWDPEGWGEWSLPEFKEIMSRWQKLEGGWNATYLGNHDQPRIVSRFGDVHGSSAPVSQPEACAASGDDGEYRTESAKLLATFLLTTRGTPYLYQGDEIGMANADFASLDELDDPMTVGAVEQLIASGVADSYEDVRALVNHTSRDHSRTPMQWTAADHAGFTAGEPWLRVNDDYREVNAEAARADPDSVWHHYRRLIDHRHEDETLVYGDYDLLLPDHERLYAYTRTLGDERRLVVLNWADEPSTFDPVGVDTAGAEAVIANYDDPPADPTGDEFRPYEAVVYAL